MGKIEISSSMNNDNVPKEFAEYLWLIPFAYLQRA